MNKKIIIPLISLATILLLVSIIFLIIVRFQQPTASPTTTPAAQIVTTNTTTSNSQTTTQSNPTSPIPTTTTQPTAQHFTERYGSFSSDSNSQNIKDLQAFMTDSMWRASEAIINQNADTTAETYYGIATQIGSIDLTDYTSGASGATAVVSTRRSEVTTVGGQPRIFTQSARLQLKKVNNTWKVDHFEGNF
jgi:hypothetical protein